MAEIITEKDITANPVNINNLRSAVAPAQQEFAGFKSLLKDVNETLGTVKEIIGQIKNLKQKKDVDDIAIIGKEQTGFNTSPANIPDGKPINIQPQAINQIKRQETIKMEKQKIDKEKVKMLIREMIADADKLPDDIKEKQIKEVIGENFKNFKYKYGVININSEMIIDKFADALKGAIEKIINND